MEPLRKFLVRFFKRSDAIQDDLSERWRENLNRRTIYIVLGIAILSVYAYVAHIQPPQAFPAGELVTVSEGASLKDISASLKEQGVIRSPLIFRSLVTVLGHERGARAGDYLFKEPKNVWEIARAISIGAYGLEPIRIRIPEGATTKEMAALFNKQLLRFNSTTFLSKAMPKEGYLFPDTYFFLPNATEDTVLQTMSQNFDEHLTEVQPLLASSTHSLSDIVIMASIIEREARNTKDRKMISGVLWNRMKRGMALQVDVTFLYTMGKGTFQLTLEDLRSDSPYNTYVHKGLPPGPIGSPSIDSIRAALQPTKNDYLYYLADGNGITHFSRTYEEHRAKKFQYLGT